MVFHIYKKKINGLKFENVEDFLAGIWFIKGVAKNQRVNNQSGDFIFVGRGQNVFKELFELPEKFIIVDAESKKVLLEQLESLNIHGGAVYPDLAHMSNYIKNKYISRNKIQDSPKQKIVKTMTMSNKQDSSNRAFKGNTSKKPKVIPKPILKPFDYNLLQERSKDTLIESFVKHHSLNKDKFLILLENFIYMEKKPLWDDVIAVRKQQEVLSVGNRNQLAKELIAEIEKLKDEIQSLEEEKR